MDKAVVIGIYDFFSFHTCKALLNRGFEVVGVRIDEIEDGLFIEEKRLEIGRNANFTEMSLSEWEQKGEEDTHGVTIFFSIYDLYMTNKEYILQKEMIIRPILKYMETNKSNTDVVFVQPIQLLNQPIIPILDQVASFGRRNHSFYLPSIYGPWQSFSCMFQQAILSKLKGNEVTKNHREWTKDVLFIDDAVEMVVELLETNKSVNPFACLLESGRKNYWAECAAFLQLTIDEENTKHNESYLKNKEIVRVPVKKLTPAEVSITEQIEHAERLYKHLL